MGLLSKINDISSKIGVMLSKLADDYANADLGRFTDIKAAPANQQLALFKKRLEAIRPAAAREPVRALDTVLHSIPHLAKDNQWEAYQTVLSDRIFSDGIRAADGNSDSLNKAFRTIWRFRNTTYLQTFQQFLRCEAFHSHRMFPGCVQDEMFFIIQKMPKNDQQKALEEVFCTPRVKTILNDRDYSAKWFTESLFKFLHQKDLIAAALEMPSLYEAIKADPTIALDAFRFNVGTRTDILATLLESDALDKSKFFSENQKSTLIYTFNQMAEHTAYDIGDDACIALAKIFIAAVQKRVPREIDGAAAYVTPMLDVEGHLVANFGKILSNEDREYRGQSTLSFSEINRRFHQADLGWELRPVNTVEDQIAYNRLLPKNDNLYTRVVKRNNSQEIHAVIGHETGDVNVSIEPVKN